MAFGHIEVKKITHKTMLMTVVMIKVMATETDKVIVMVIGN